MRVLITGGAGFVGSHTAEYFAEKGDEVVIVDNLSRARILGTETKNVNYNKDYLIENYDVEFLAGDIVDKEFVEKASIDADAIIHTAAQVAVTASVKDPRTDFEVNTLGTFNVLEAARKSKSSPVVVFCSTNKVYGDNVNKISVNEEKTRYVFGDDGFKKGIPEIYSTDLCEHTPYGASKFAADVYAQDYGKRNEVDTGIFRMSCIYGPRQFGSEDQGWIAHFTISSIFNRALTIYGNGKQVRDVLYVTDLVKGFDAFINNRGKYSGEVYNIGGGPSFTLSLVELLEILESKTGKRSETAFSNWRPSDQKVYISDISKAKNDLNWEPIVSPVEGLDKLVNWIERNDSLF